MKVSGKLLFLAILAIISVALILSAVQQSDPYLTVTQVVEHSDRYQGKVIQIIGVISAGPSGENVTNAFRLADSQESINVLYSGTLPENFKVGVQAVIVGTLTGEKTLEASSILLKCPSKYQDQGQTSSGFDYTFYAVVGLGAIAGTYAMIFVLKSLRKPLKAMTPRAGPR